MPSIDLSRYEKKKNKKPTRKTEGFDLYALMNRDITFGSKELSDKKKEYLYLELYSLLQAGIDLKNSIELIAGGQEKEADKALFTGIKNNVLKGVSLSAALGQTGRFSPYEIYSLEIGEETARLTEILEDLARYYQNKIQQRRKVVSALTYPSIVLCTSMGAVFFMLKFVVPMFSDVFRRFGGELPWITQQIVDLSNALELYSFPFFLLACSLGGLLWYVRKMERFRKISSAIVLRIPVVGALVQKVYLARFCNTMRLLLSAHIPLLRAISLSRKTIGYYPIESSLAVVEQDILQGHSLNESLRAFRIYPVKMIMQLKIAEEGNKLDVFFGRLAEQYLKDVEYQTSTFNNVMQPVLTLIIGLIVGTIVIAIYLPMFQLSNTIQ